jgi:hypothetical protein
MGGSSSQSASGAYAGNNGDRVYSNMHTDIDQSTIDIRCRDGNCRVTLEEAIWWSWVTREDRQLSAGGRMNETIEVDSDWFDADHRLIIVATADGTSVDVNFESVDR